MVMEQEFREEIANLYGKDGADLIEKAFEFAKIKHAGQKRDTGEDYIIHPYNVAKILVGFRADLSSVVSGLLHDCLEDTDCTEKEIRDNFGNVIFNICLGASKIEPIKHSRRQHLEENENLRKMFLTMSKDARVAFVKLADRLHNMRTLDIKSRENQLKIAKETMDIYVPLAERLGMNQLKHMLEDLSFKYIFPEDFKETSEYLEEKYRESVSIVEFIKSKIKEIAKEHGIDARLQSRVKSTFGVYKKTNTKGRENIFDIIANRIIVKEIKDCYTMLGAVHNIWKPVEGRIKDYIAQPKKNLYRSLHTTVLYPTPEGAIPFEIQIRTEEMHIFCEYGMAAHWMYKESGSKATKQVGNSELYNLKTKASSESSEVAQETEVDEFLQIVKTGFYAGKIFVFTPTLNVVELPVGSIPLDFAYNIHTNLGNRCVGAKVNDKMVPITTELKTGDVIEIMTSSSRCPSRDWLKIVKSKEATNKIRAFFKKERKEENIKIGKDMLEDYAKRNGFTLAKLFEDKESILDMQEKYHLNSVDEIYAMVGYGGLTSAQVLSKFIAKIKSSAQKERKTYSDKVNKPHEGVIIGGHSDLLKKFAKCCNPIPGDEIVGYVSRGKGATIHRKDCSYLDFLEADRIIKTEWNEESSNEFYNATFKVVAKNTLGVLNTISNKIAENKIDITFLSIDKNHKGEDAFIDIGVRIKSRKELNEILNKLRSMNEVYDVYR